MKTFYQFLYSAIVLPLLWLALRTLGLVNGKIRRGIRGRRGLFASLQSQVATKLGPGTRLWFHASSLGEFEQAKPIIAALKQRRNGIRIIVTFFSPSGFEHSKKYPLADILTYLPFDTRANARRFLDLVQPDVAVIIRYDVWPNHLWELQRRGIPTLIANATMRANTRRRFPLVRHFHHFVYDAINDILTVSKDDAEAFAIFALSKAAIEAIGDTRYDQVSIRSAEAKRRHIVAGQIVQGKRVLVAGSTWPEDEAVLIPAVVKLQETFGDLLLILVPHEPTPDYLEELESEIPGASIRFSALNDYAGERILIVDSIGILLSLYSYAHLAYIGGSFKQNVHNVLEAAVYGVPVVYGPKHRNSQEAVQLAEAGGGFVVQDAQQMYDVVKSLLEDDEKKQTAGRIAGEFVRRNVGATQRFLSHLDRYLK